MLNHFQWNSVFSPFLSCPASMDFSLSCFLSVPSQSALLLALVVMSAPSYHLAHSPCGLQPSIWLQLAREADNGRAHAHKLEPRRLPTQTRVTRGRSFSNLRHASVSSIRQGYKYYRSTKATCLSERGIYLFFLSKIRGSERRDDR